MESNVFKKVPQARNKLNQLNLKKSGFNKYSNFDYFELSDFLPSVVKIFAEVGLCSRFYIKENEAYLEIIDSDNPESMMIFSSPVVDAGMKGATPIQQLGATHTYMRRYLWLEAMEITENDAIETTDNKQEEKNEKSIVITELITESQYNTIFKYYTGENLKKLLDANGIDALDKLPRKKASYIISKLKEREKNEA